MSDIDLQAFYKALQEEAVDTKLTWVLNIYLSDEHVYGAGLVQEISEDHIDNMKDLLSIVTEALQDFSEELDFNALSVLEEKDIAELVFEAYNEDSSEYSLGAFKITLSSN